MKTTFVIPTYWSGPSSVDWKTGDEIYDHPTPLDQQGTLTRTLNSMKILKNGDFQLVVIVAPTSDSIAHEAVEKVEGLVNSTSIGIETTVFGPAQLKTIHEVLISGDREDDIDLLSLKGYSNVRNLCLFLPHVLGSDIAVLIDDDEVFEDADFTTKMQDFIGKKYKGKWVNGVAGYYLQKNGDYHVRMATKPWMKHWGQYKRMNEAFDKVIGSGPRLKETSFVFGGNMIIHRNLYSRVPFDPEITRGEDIDYLINAKMFGFTFFLDNKLAIKHLPPPKTHPDWMQLRQDIYRFIYEKAKIDCQMKIRGMTKVNIEDLDPYPGYFLKRDLQERIETTCRLLSEEYKDCGDRQGSRETLENISLAKAQISSLYNPFDSLLKLQQRWQKLIVKTRNNPILAGVVKQRNRP